MKIKTNIPTCRTKKIRKGDQVIAITGDCKGQSGTVQSFKGDRVLVLGLNLRKKSVRKTQNTPGRIIEIERPIHISNLKVCDQEGKGIKLKVGIDKSGQRQFIYSDKDKEKVYRSLKTPK